MARSRRSPKRRRRAKLERLESRVVLTATPIISEFLAGNSGGLRDADGDSSDWLEIFNPTESSVNLQGWTLTDDADEIDKWTFPDVSIAPNEFLIVFASGKDRDDPAEELHVNWQLSSDGEYLAMAQPDGTIASEFAPTFPEQIANVSYGTEFLVEALVEQDSTAKIFVPDSDALGSTWQLEGFDDSAWTDGTFGVGFGIDRLGFNVRYVTAKESFGFSGDIETLGIAESVLSSTDFQAFELTETHPVVNFLGTGGNGRFDNDVAFPNQQIGDDVNNFVIEATATIDIPTSGNWSFGVNSDDGFGLTLTRGGNVFSSEFAGLRGSSDTITTFFLPESGQYELRLVAFENLGGASAELFAAPGIHNSFSGDFRLVGDLASGGLRASLGPSELVSTDIAAQMLGVNSSVYIRTEFDVADPSLFNRLGLRANFDDGFIAYLNGVEIARRNAPANIDYSSSAENARLEPDVLSLEDLLLSPTSASLLVEGNNVFAIHGLNVSVGDGSFLMMPELLAMRLFEDELSYFAEPSPGSENVNPVEGLTARVEASQPAGFYEAPISVSLSTTTDGATIRYTTDGSEPSMTHGMEYIAPINVSATTNIRAIAVKDGYLSTPSITRTYLFLDDVLTQSPDGSAPPGWPSDWGANTVDYGIDPQILAAEGGERVREALLSLPTWSITTNFDNLFDAETGIYANARREGRDWERPAAVELINPDGSEGFQVNAGLRIRGGFSRAATNPKHSFKLFFRGEYGDSELNYPIHGDEGTSQFKKIDLRTQQAFSWHIGDGYDLNTWVTEVMARNSQRDIGEPYTHSSWFHLYLNGQYWGLYQTQERPEANFGASYFGGSASEYDVIKPEPGPYNNQATDGDLEAYGRLWEQAVARAPDGRTPAFVSNEAYFRAQGKNPDGSDNPDYEVLLDVDNLINYMMITLYTGNLDGPITNFGANEFLNNYFTVRNRNGREGFVFFQHDAEVSLLEAQIYHQFVLNQGPNVNRNGPWNHPKYESSVLWFNPQWLHQQLMANDEYRLRFADAVQSAFFHEGPMSVSAQIARLDEQVEIIDLATIAESARWGDAATPRANFPITRDNFLNAIDTLRDSFLPFRQTVVLKQFQETFLALKANNGDYSIIVPAPLFPDLDAPQFLVDGALQHGGDASTGAAINFASPEGTVYYTTDGTDPRELGGAVSSNAQTFETLGTTTKVVPAGATWKYLDTGTNLGSIWRDPGFDDSAWDSGEAELGYGDGGEATVISFGPNSGNKYITTYFRNTFEIDGSAGDITSAILRLRRDDGAVVYVNGVEALRDNMPGGDITSSTLAGTAVGGSDESDYFRFTIDPSLLQLGQNVIAVEVHQAAATSSDLSFDAELTVGQQDASLAAIELSGTTRLMARTLREDGTWSPLEQAVFAVDSVPASADNLRVTEVHYNPADPAPGLTPPLDDSDSYEFVELKNVGSETISLQGVFFADGVEFQFDSGSILSLEPGEFVLVVRDQSAFAARYGDGLPVAGQFASGGLNNGGERLEINAADGSRIQALTYDDNGDDWHPETDGFGPSLTVIDTEGDYDDGNNWRASFEIGGSPGSDGVPGITDVVINEVLSHTDAPQLDSIELFNTTQQPVDISGWYLSDSSTNFLKYQIPDSTIIPAGGFIVFDESHFNPTPETPGPNDFALNSAKGDQVWVVATGPTGEIERFVDNVEFGAQANGESWGRWPDSGGPLYPMTSVSLGQPNPGPRVGPLVINELMYHPVDSDNGIDSDTFEYLEIANPTSSIVELTRWKVGGGIDFDFPDGVTIGPNQTIAILTFDPVLAENADLLAAFQSRYAIGETAQLIGPYSGKLNNAGDVVQLFRPDAPPIDEPDFYPMLLEDEVRYGDEAPWPQSPDGDGDTLGRLPEFGWGNDPTSWNADDPSPGVNANAAPIVNSTTVQAGMSQRAHVDTLLLEFSEATNLDQLIASGEIVNAVSITNLCGSATELVLSPTQFLYETDAALGIGRLTWSLDGFADSEASLGNGHYQLTINSAMVTDLDGSPLDGNGDGTAGDDYEFTFHRLAGDVDGNAVVDAVDLQLVETAFDATPQDGHWNANADLDRNGVVNTRDRMLVLRFDGDAITDSGGAISCSLVYDVLDVNEDGRISPLDALRIINHLSGPDAGVDITTRELAHYDTSISGSISPLDALRVINYLSRANLSGGEQDPSVLAGLQAAHSTGDLLGDPMDDDLAELLAEDVVRRNGLF